MQSEIKVDMDWRPPESWLKQWLAYALINCFRESAVTKGWVIEKSRHGYHIRIRLQEPIEDELALRLQFLLGDDRVRCKLNYGRWRAGIEDWNKLWKCKVGRDNKK